MLETFIVCKVQLERKLASLSRQPGGLFVEERRIRHAQSAYLRAVDEPDTDPYDFALRLLAKTQKELEVMRQARREELHALQANGS